MMQQVHASPSLSHWLSQASPQPPSSSWANSACAAWGYAGMHNLLHVALSPALACTSHTRSPKTWTSGPATASRSRPR